MNIKKVIGVVGLAAAGFGAYKFLKTVNHKNIVLNGLKRYQTKP